MNGIFLFLTALSVIRVVNVRRDFTKVLSDKPSTGGTEMSDTDKTPCSCCRELIAKGAPVCHYCGRNQKLLVRCLAPTLQWL
jgi:hypothetical protein